MSRRFGYDAAIVDAFPHLHCGLVAADGLENGDSTPALVAQYQAVQAAIRFWTLTADNPEAFDPA